MSIRLSVKKRQKYGGNKGDIRMSAPRDYSKVRKSAKKVRKSANKVRKSAKKVRKSAKKRQKYGGNKGDLRMSARRDYSSHRKQIRGSGRLCSSESDCKSPKLADKVIELNTSIKNLTKTINEKKKMLEETNATIKNRIYKLRKNGMTNDQMRSDVRLKQLLDKRTKLKDAIFTMEGVHTRTSEIQKKYLLEHNFGSY